MSRLNLIRKILNRKRTLPFYLIQFVTSRCNCNCGHCFNYKRRKNDELSINEIRKITKSLGNLYWMGLTGGEPFLREDIDKIAYLYSKNTNVNQIKIPTNGSMPERIRKKTKSILNKCKDTRVAVNFSIDEIGKKHDKIRGYDGLFENIRKSLSSLQGMEKDNENLTATATITVSKSNEDNLLEIYRFIRNEFNVKNISIVLTRGNPKDSKEKLVDPQNYQKLKEAIDLDIENSEGGYYDFFESDLINAKTQVQRNLTFDIHSNKKEERDYYCSAGNLNGVIYENGEVAPCELLSTIGNLKDYDYDFKKLWFSKGADELREYISNKNCLCTHECFLNTSMIANLKSYPKMLKKFIKIKLGI